MVEPACTGPFRVGDDIIGYKVLGLLGAGGHAFVYESKDPYLGNPVAIKVIQKPPGGSDIVSRGRAEAKILTELQHPNVVRVHIARPLGNSMICIVMEKLEGLSLRQMLRLYKRLTITETLRIIRQIADALAAAHKMNVIHRDVKPENVFVLPPDNKVKVLDFGIAKLAGLGLTTNKFRFHGTPIYMSPEHLRDGTVTVRSDVFQLMIVAFEMITGSHPYLAESDFNIEAVALRQMQKPTPALSTRVADAPASVEYFIQKGTAKDPNQRYQSMDELIVAIDKLLAERASTHPHETKRIRYLDASAVQAALALDSQHDPWAENEPDEPVNTDVSAPPFGVAPVVPTVPLATRSSNTGPTTPDNATGGKPAEPTQTRPPAASTSSAPLKAQPPQNVPPPAALEKRQTVLGLGPNANQPGSGAPESVIANRAPTVLAPTVELSRERAEIKPLESAAQSLVRGTAAPSTPAATAVPSASVRPAQTDDAYTSTPSRASTPSSSHKKRITPKLLASGAVMGAALSLAASWPLIQEAREKRHAQAQPPQTSASPASMVQSPTPQPEEPATLPTPPPLASQPLASPQPAVNPEPSEPPAATAEHPTPTALAVPPKPKKALPKPAATNQSAAGASTQPKSQKPTKEDIARMQARLREFNADMERQARDNKPREASK